MSNDKQIEDYRKKIEAKRKELGKQPRSYYKSNGLLTTPTLQVNLNTLRTERACYDLAIEVARYVTAGLQANEWLDTDFDDALDGYPVAVWVNDIKQRLSIIRWNTEKAKLNTMDKKLAELLTNETKVSNSIADIAKELEL